MNKVDEEKWRVALYWHMEGIQKIINRLSYISLSIKLMMSVFILVFSISSHMSHAVFMLMSFIFWIMDGYYIHVERKFRELFFESRNGEVKLYNYDVSGYKTGVTNYLSCLVSLTVFPFYFAAFVIGSGVI